MRFLSAIFSAALLLCVGLPIQAAGPDDSYLNAYRQIQEGDALATSGDAKGARLKYENAQTELKQVQRISPGWNTRAVEYRLEYVAGKLKDLAPPTAAPETKESPKTSPPAKAAAPAPPAPVDQVAALNEMIAKLQADNTALQAKLKEALSAQPAAVDPRELEKAQEKISQLEKEKELLRTNLEQAEAKKPQAADLAMFDQVKGELGETKKKLVDTVATVASLTQEKQALETANQKLQQEIAAARGQDKSGDLQKQLAEVQAEAQKQAGVAAEAQKQLATLRQAQTAESPAVVELKKELEQARQQVKAQSELIATLNSKLTKTEEAAKTSGSGSAELEKKLAALEQERDIWLKQKGALESQLAAKAAAPAPITAGANDPGKVKQLEQERDDLLRKLSDSNKELYEAKNKNAADQTEFLKRQIGSLQARVDVLDARRIPYTSEELALFKTPPVAVKMEEAKPARKEVRELKPEAAKLVSEAQRAFADKKYAEAEAKYQQVVQMDPENPITLANLAAIQLERDKFKEAGDNLGKALALAPDDAYSLSVYGILNFRQEKYDEALDALSKSAQVDPKNPETQNYLGITLSQKGQREAAESALRKAIQLAPNYAGAHHNLAVIYATQKPPFIELAKYHYQKALAAGHPANLDLEKILKAPAPAAEKK